MYHVPMHVGKSVPPTLVLEDQLLVVDSHQVQKGSLKIVYVDRIFRYVVAEFISLSVAEPWFDTATGHPGGKATGMMIPTIAMAHIQTLGIIGPAEFPSPNHQGVFQETALL